MIEYAAQPENRDDTIRPYCEGYIEALRFVLEGGEHD